MVKCSVEGCGREAVAQFGCVALCEYHLRRYVERVEKLAKGKGFERVKEEFMRDASRLVGKRIKDFAVGEDGIDIIVEDGTTMELYCLATDNECDCNWYWTISKEGE